MNENENITKWEDRFTEGKESSPFCTGEQVRNHHLLFLPKGPGKVCSNAATELC